MCPSRPASPQELPADLRARRRGYLFESNRHTHYAVRTVHTIVADVRERWAYAKRVYPHLLRHSIATLLLYSGHMPIDQVRKFLRHRRMSTTQI
jgi:integrase/recombinase XerD